MNKLKIKIDVVSDVVCPWCYIGKRRLEKAMNELKDKMDFEIHYYPFELNPTTPRGGYDQKTYLTDKFGGEERYKQLTDQVSAVAAQEGLHFNYAKQFKSPNTLDLHRVIWEAGTTSKQLDVVEAFFKAYFEDGADLTLQENIIAIASGVGMDAFKVEQLLKSDKWISEVKTREVVNGKSGITGVPFFIINDKYAVSGAQPAAVFVEALPEIASKEVSEGASCNLDDKNC